MLKLESCKLHPKTKTFLHHKLLCMKKSNDHFFYSRRRSLASYWGKKWFFLIKFICHYNIDKGQISAFLSCFRCIAKWLKYPQKKIKIMVYGLFGLLMFFIVYWKWLYFPQNNEILTFKVFFVFCFHDFYSYNQFA